MRGCDMGTNTMTMSDKAFRITVYITGHDMKNVSDATHMSFPSELLDSVTRKYREESVDSYNNGHGQQLGLWQRYH